MHASAFQDGEPKSRGFDNILWWLSTAEPELIYDCTVDRNRYRIVGYMVCCTWLFATLAWTYFFSTTVSSPVAFIPMGVFMGLVVLCIDRALIKGINRSKGKGYGPLVLRFVLALTIGLFMAQPAVLYLFDREVKMQASLDNEMRRRAKRQQLDSLYAGQKSDLQSQEAVLKNGLKTRYADMLAAQRNYLAETDGTGGSGKVGISVIANAKKAEFERLESIYRQSEQQDQPKIDTIQNRLRQIETEIRMQEAQFTGLLNNGFLTRIEAMQNLIDSNNAVAFRYYLIVAILMLIELMPVIVKSLLPSGPYEARVRETELAELALIGERAGHWTKVEAHLREKMATADIETIDHFVTAQKGMASQAINELKQEWQESRDKSLRSILRKLRSRILASS